MGGGLCIRGQVRSDPVGLELFSIQTFDRDLTLVAGYVLLTGQLLELGLEPDLGVFAAGRAAEQTCAMGCVPQEVGTIAKAMRYLDRNVPSGLTARSLSAFIIEEFVN